MGSLQVKLIAMHVNEKAQFSAILITKNDEEKLDILQSKLTFVPGCILATASVSCCSLANEKSYFLIH